MSIGSFVNMAASLDALQKAVRLKKRTIIKCCDTLVTMMRNNPVPTSEQLFHIEKELEEIRSNKEAFAKIYNDLALFYEPDPFHSY